MNIWILTVLQPKTDPFFFVHDESVYGVCNFNVVYNAQTKPNVCMAKQKKDRQTDKKKEETHSAMYIRIEMKWNNKIYQQQRINAP